MSRKTRPIIKIDAQGRSLSDSEHDETFRGEYAGTNLLYAGYARPGESILNPVWKIFRMTYDGSNNLTAIEWPVNPTSGAISSDHEFIWNDRAALTYV